MIAFVRGKLVSVLSDSIIVDVNGLGYRLQVPGSLFSRLPSPGAEVQLHTHLVVREDGMYLYGFRDEDELNCFRLLLNVSGVGPKGALAVLSSMAPDTLRQVLAGENVALLTKVPGVGKKTAQRIILELKDKLGRISLGGPVQEDTMGEEVDALAALLALGYARAEAHEAVKEAAKNVAVKENGGQVNDLVRLALQWLGQKNLR